MTNFQPELWVDGAAAAVRFYEAAFGAVTLHLVGEGDDIVAQLAVGDACFWVAAASPGTGRFSPAAISGRTSRTLLVTDDPDAVFARAVNAGATGTSTVSEEHGWRVGRVVDPYGHEWEIGRPIGDWPAAEAVATRRERKGGADEA
jgi:PhnB protein